MLRASLASRRGAFTLEVDLEIPGRSTLVVVGESGSGKTTLLRLLAGLARAERGHLALDGEVLLDTARGLEVEAARRPVGYVPQDYALFPHLSVFDNVAFGLRAERRPRAEVRRRATAWLERLGIGELARRRPEALSGGQRQRAALARALVLEPRLLLLDEPLSALDPPTRRAVQSELTRLLGEISCTTVYVTHSPAEALALGSTILVLEAGRVDQIGERDDLLRHPRSAYVAGFMGVNLLRGRVARRLAGGLAAVRTADGEILVPDPGERDEVFLTVSPREITVWRERPAGSAQNVFRGPVEEIAPEPPQGERVRVVLGTRPPLVAEVTRAAVEALELRAGMEVYAAFKATGVGTHG